MSDNIFISGGGVIHREPPESPESNQPPETSAIVPSPRIPGITVRTATMDDWGFIDQLQKMHSHMVGFLHKKSLESYIEGEHVLIAEEGTGHEAEGIREEEPSPRPSPGGRGSEKSQSAEPKAHRAQPNAQCLMPDALGYCIFKDQYMKRDDVGIIYQLNVLPLKQRNLIGATLVKEAFARAAYGCKLFCCWCAQDIQANWFWESIGFVPLAFRTGSRGKQRIHIFWQRRIREEENQRNTGAPGDSPVPLTPYWFPYQTQAGAVREDRIVLPIPPDTHWRDAKPLVLPAQVAPHPGLLPEGEGDLPKTLPGGAPVKARPEQPKLTGAQRAAIKRAQSAHLKGVPVGKKAVVTGSGVKYVDRDDYVPELDDPDELREQAEKKEKKKRATTTRAKHDPKIIKQARELRDRYLEEVNERGLLPEAWSDGKYDVSRALGSDEDIRVRPDEVRLLDAA